MPPVGSVFVVIYDYAFVKKPKIYLMQNPLNMSVSSVISTYVYNISLKAAQPDYSFGTALGLFQNGVAVILTVAVNWIANKISGEGLF